MNVMLIFFITVIVIIKFFFFFYRNDSLYEDSKLDSFKKTNKQKKK